MCHTQLLAGAQPHFIQLVDIHFSKSYCMIMESNDIPTIKISTVSTIYSPLFVQIEEKTDAEMLFRCKILTRPSGDADTKYLDEEANSRQVIGREWHFSNHLRIYTGRHIWINVSVPGSSGCKQRRLAHRPSQYQ